jgi:hypothetical protein
VGKAAAGATDIMEASASGVKCFFHSVIQIGQIRNSIRTFLSWAAIALKDYNTPRRARLLYPSICTAGQVVLAPLYVSTGFETVLRANVARLFCDPLDCGKPADSSGAIQIAA